MKPVRIGLRYFTKKNKCLKMKNVSYEQTQEYNFQKLANFWSLSDE